jgi:hypothetical protein
MSSNMPSFTPQYLNASNVGTRPPVAQPIMTPSTQQAEIPVAIPIASNSRQQRGTNNDQVTFAFMEVTNCRDRQLAERYVREAGGNLSTAIDRYLQSNERQMAVV